MVLAHKNYRFGGSGWVNGRNDLNILWSSSWGLGWVLAQEKSVKVWSAALRQGYPPSSPDFRGEMAVAGDTQQRVL